MQSKNLHRRHLTTSQRAAIAAESVPLLSEEAKEQQLSGLKRGNSIPVMPKTAEREPDNDIDNLQKGRVRNIVAREAG